MVKIPAMPTGASFASFEKELNRLVASFEGNLAEFKKPGYVEAQLRDDFLNPFFRALGWDLENRAGLIQSEREVEIESRTRIQGRQKRADYLFRADKRDRFVCEAKKPADQLHSRYAFQAKRYAWNKGLPLAILTDFGEMKIYIVGGRPFIDEPQVGEWKTYHFKQYVYLDKRDAFERPHILTPSLSDRANFAVGTGDLFLTGTAGVTSIIPDPSIKEDLKYILGLLNSRPIALYAVTHSPPFSGGFFKFSAPYLRKLPIRRIDFRNAADKVRHDKLVGLVDKMLMLMPKLRAAKSESEKATLQNAVTATNRQIDQIVYELYDLTPKEIALIEGAQ